jgi:hypothetical protein
MYKLVLIISLSFFKEFVFVAPPGTRGIARYLRGMQLHSMGG